MARFAHSLALALALSACTTAAVDKGDPDAAEVADEIGNDASDADLAVEATADLGTEAADGHADGEAIAADLCDSDGAAPDCSHLDGVCVVGACDPATGGCIARPDLAEGRVCDDGDLCTTGDACAGGECRGAEAGLDCSHLDDACGRGWCDPKTGACAALPRLRGTLCDDGDPCTDGDRCVLGSCAGVPLDCSVLDVVAGCGIGVCEAETGACALASRPDATPCDDGDPCTGGDACSGGSCAGAIDLCGPCAGATAGDACDDGDPCTTGGTCVAADGEGDGLACAGELIDCSESDGPCVIGVCNATNGACESIPRPEGTPCDDGDACTSDETCYAGGVCHGPAMPTCGVPVDLCEPQGVDNGSWSTALPVALEGDSAVLVGLVAGEAEDDWYRLTGLLGGQLLTARTRANCGEAIDTLLGLHATEGPELLIADNDGANDGGFSLIDSFELPADGDYFLAVTSLAADGVGSYLLEITLAWPPPCASDSDCGCPLLERCAAAVGECEPRYPVEAEPNDLPAQAGNADAGEPLIGAIASPVDADRYTIALTGGDALTVEVRGGCEGELDSELSIFGPGGDELAWDADGGAAGHAKIEAWEVPEDGSYQLRVRGENATTGTYLLVPTVKPGQMGECVTAGDCGCADLDCRSEPPGAPKACVPAHAANEDGDPVALDPDVRTWAAIDAPYDADTFEVALAAGQTYAIETGPFCGSTLDTRVKVFDPAGAEVASADGGGQGWYAALPAFEPQADGTHTVRVTAAGPATGEYAVEVRQGAVGP